MTRVGGERDEIDYLALLFVGAQWQDELLQSYRSFHITLQSLLLATGAALTVAVFSLETRAGSLVSAGILVAIGALALSISAKLQSVVVARGEDVNWWHRKLIEHENSVPPDRRYLTEFKIHQKLRRSTAEHLEDFVTSEEVERAEARELVGRQLGHTRKVLDRRLFWGTRLVWILLLGSAISYTLVVQLGVL